MILFNSFDIHMVVFLQNPAEAIHQKMRKALEAAGKFCLWKCLKIHGKYRRVACAWIVLFLSLSLSQTRIVYKPVMESQPHHPRPRPRPRPHHPRPRPRPRPDHSRPRPHLPRPRPFKSETKTETETQYFSCRIVFYTKNIIFSLGIFFYTKNIIFSLGIFVYMKNIIFFYWGYWNLPPIECF